MRIYRKLLLAFLALSIVPMLIIGSFEYNNAKGSLQKEIFYALDSKADHEVDAIEAFFAERRSDIVVLGLRNVVKTNISALTKFSRDPSNPAYVSAGKALDEQLTIFQSAYHYIDIMLTDMEGRIAYVFNPKHRHELNQTISDTDNILKKIKTGIYIGDVRKTGHKEHPYTLCMAGPAYDDAGKVAGLVHAELDMNAVYELLQDQRRSQGSYETLLVGKTADKKLIYLSPLKFDPGAILNKTTMMGSKDALPSQSAASGKSGSGLDIDYRGKSVLSAWRWIPSLRWGLVTKIDESEAFLPVERLTKLLIVVLFITILVTIAIVFMLARSISYPIVKLREAAIQIGEGSLDTRIEVSSRDEIGDLSSSFNRMTESIKEKRDEIIAVKAFTDNIISSIIDTLIIVDSEGMIKMVNQAMLDLLGYSVDELIGKPAGMIFAEEEEEEEEEEEALFKGTGLERLIREGSVRDHDITYVTKSGERILVSFSGSVMYEKIADSHEKNKLSPSSKKRYPLDATQIIGVVGIARDMRGMRLLIADLENSKSQLEDFSKNLELKVEERTGDLVKSQKATINIMEDMQESHEELKKFNIELNNAKQKIESFSKDLETKVKERTFELSVLYDVSNAISYTLDHEQLLKLITESLFKIVGYDICVSLVFDAHTAKIAIKQGYQRNASLVEKVKNNLIDFTSTLTGEDIGRKRISSYLFPVEVDQKISIDSSDAKKKGRKFDKLNSFFNVPFIVGGKVIGMINVSSCEENAFSENDIRLIYTIANQASDAIGRLQTVIKAEKNKMESMVQSMVEGVLMTDEKNEIVVLNPQARRMLGFNLTDEITSEHLVERMKEIGLYDTFQKCLKEKKLVRNETTVIRGEKSIVLSCEIAMVKEAEGSIIGMVTVLKDITEEKEMDKMKTEFVSTVSHELRTPLTTIKEFISIISKEIPGRLTKDQKKYVDIVKGNVDRLTRLITNLLDISKIEAGKVDIKKQLVDITNLVNEIVSSFTPELKGKHIELKSLFSATAIAVYVDPDKITQVFTNLISNAMKFTPEKGKITVEIKDTEKEIVCSVTDTGKGIGKDDMDRLFGKFQQFDRIAGAGAKGTGLGLAISKELVELHKGSIWAESKINGGSKFVFTLPKYDREDILQEKMEGKIASVGKENEKISMFIVRLDDCSEGGKELEENRAQKVFLPISAAIQKVILSGDFVTGKNEVVVFMPVNKEEASKLFVQLKMAIKVPIFEIEEQFKIGFSCGYATYPDDADNAEDLLKKVYKSCVREREAKLKKTIMIVDDEPQERSIVRELLQASGYSNFIEAGDGLTALEKIKTTIPDLLILDMKMRGMNGYELIGMLKENTETKDIPVLIMSGYKVEIDKLEEYVKKKTIPMVGKPFDLDQLRKLINYLL
ncbi:MAG: ATP-binding protein [Pseudomonadota bacterium]